MFKKEGSIRDAFAKDEAFAKQHQIDRLKNRRADNVPVVNSCTHVSGNHSDHINVGNEKQDWEEIPKIELVVVPDNLVNTAEDTILNDPPSEGAHVLSKNLIPSSTVQPPGKAHPVTTILSRELRSSQKSSTSQNTN